MGRPAIASHHMRLVAVTAAKPYLHLHRGFPSDRQPWRVLTNGQHRRQLARTEPQCSLNGRGLVGKCKWQVQAVGLVQPLIRAGA